MPPMHLSDSPFSFGFPLTRLRPVFRSGALLRRLVTCTWFGVTASVQAGTCAASGVSVLPVLPGVSVVHGRWRAVDPLTPDHIATTVVLGQGPELTVLDPGPTVAQGRGLARALRCDRTQRVVRLVNSHAHAEQTLANAAFTAPVAATAATRAAMQGRCPSCLASMRVDLGPAALRGTRIRWPTEELRDGEWLQAGGRDWQVVEMPLAHTESDLVLWNANERIALAGPLVDGVRLVLAQGSVQGWLDALERLASMRAQWLIGQHLVVQGDAVPEALAAQRQALCHLVHQAWQGLEKGWTESEVLQQAADGAGREVDRRLQRFNLLRVWREMESRWIAQQPMPSACSTPDVGR